MLGLVDEVDRFEEILAFLGSIEVILLAENRIPMKMIPLAVFGPVGCRLNSCRVTQNMKLLDTRCLLHTLLGPTFSLSLGETSWIHAHHKVSGVELVILSVVY